MKLIRTKQTEPLSHTDASDVLEGQSAVPSFVFGYRDPGSATVISFFRDEHPEQVLGKGQHRVTARFNEALSEDVKAYQTESAISACEARIDNGASHEEAFTWLRDEISRIENGELIYD